MTAAERSAKQAAQELFASLSGGEEFVTVEQLERKLREIYKLQKKTTEKDAAPSRNGNVSIRSKADNEEEHLTGSKSSSPVRLHLPRKRIIDDINHISEEDLVNYSHNWAVGIIPAVNLTLSVPHPQSLDHISCFYRIFFHPTIFLLLLYHRFISIFSPFPTDVIARIHVIIVLAIYAIISTENVLIQLPITVYYISIIVMVISSFKMLKSMHEFVSAWNS